MKRNKLLLIVSALIFATGAVWFLHGPAAKSKTPFTPGSLEEKAKKAKNGDDSAVRDLADEVFYRYGLMLPTEMADKAKERLVRAEIDYKKNGKGNVREMDVVQAVNFLADKFKAPEFARTDLQQVKMLRAKMRLEFPSFIAPDPEKKRGLKKKLGEPMNQEVSPLEATCLLLNMVTQKALNDDFQQTPEEFAGRVRHKPSWLEGESDKPVMLLNDPRNIEKTRAVIRAAVAGMRNMNTVDAINLTDDTLDKLGIKK
jgi:hypothetical protein